MNTGKTILSQIMSYLPTYEFRRCVQRYRGNHKVKSFSCWDQYLCMVFAQLSFRESLRDIITCLRAMQNKLYHTGIRGNISKSTLADANENRDWRIYADFAQILISRARHIYKDDPFGVEINETVYALDSTTIDLCLSVFPWAKFRKHKAAIKLHALLDLHGNIPSFIEITDGKVHDVNILDEIFPEPGSYYIMDRAYIDFTRLYTLNLENAFFIIRAKSNFKFKRLYSHPIDKSTGLRCDQTIVTSGTNTKDKYPDKLRRIRFYDSENDKYFVFLTNNFVLPALTIKRFYGTSVNAVKTQIWIAVSVYVLVAIIKKQLKMDLTLYTFLQILSVTLFEKVHILQLVTNSQKMIHDSESCNQLNLFDL